MGKKAIDSVFHSFGAGVFLCFFVFVFFRDAAAAADVRAALIPADPLFDRQVYLQQIQAPLAWNITWGSDDVVVAVLDSGVDITNPDLAENIWTNTDEIPDNLVDDDHNGFVDDVHGWDFIASSADVSPKFGSTWTLKGMQHGTVVAGIIAARGGNDIGVAGLAWRVKIMPLRILDSNGEGTMKVIARAIDYARENGARVINLSFVGPDLDDALYLAIERAYNAGMVVVAASGNESKAGADLDYHPLYPVCQQGIQGRDYIIGVSAIDQHKKLAPFSNYGAACVDMVAPGQVYSTQFFAPNRPEFQERWGGVWWGTSVAAPQVSAVAALIQSIDPNATPSDIKEDLSCTATLVDSENLTITGKLGAGLLDVRAALLRAKRRLTHPDQPGVVIGGVLVSSETKGIAEVRRFDTGVLKDVRLPWGRSWTGTVSATAMPAPRDCGVEIAIAPASRSTPEVKVFRGRDQITSFFAYDPGKVLGGIQLTFADVDGDDIREIVTMPINSTQAPLVRIFTNRGVFIREWTLEPKARLFRYTLAAADVNQDGKDELIFGTGPGSVPKVLVLNALGRKEHEFSVFVPGFRGGVRVAAGDVDGDRVPELIVGAGAGGSPMVQVWSGDGRKKAQWFAYDKKFRGGVTVAVGDYDGNGSYAIITGAGAGGGPQVRVLDINGNVQAQWFAYDKKFRGGVRVTGIR